MHTRVHAHSTSEDEREAKDKERESLKRKSDHGEAKSIYVDKVSYYRMCSLTIECVLLL